MVRANRLESKIVSLTAEGFFVSWRSDTELSYWEAVIAVAYCGFYNSSERQSDFKTGTIRFIIRNKKLLYNNY